MIRDGDRRIVRIFSIGMPRRTPIKIIIIILIRAVRRKRLTGRLHCRASAAFVNVIRTASRVYTGAVEVRVPIVMIMGILFSSNDRVLLLLLLSTNGTETAFRYPSKNFG